MKKLIIVTVSVILLAISAYSQNKQNDFPVLTGPYFGQKPPGTEPEIFAPDVLVKPKLAHSNIVFTKQGTEAYWCYNGIWFSKLHNGRWLTPKLVPFSRKEFSDDAPFLSPDGKHLFFTSKRAINDSDTTRKENIWVVDIEENGWSNPKPLPPVINEIFQHWQVSVDSYGTLYFGHKITPDSNRDIYYSKYENGEYLKPVKLEKMINTEHHERNPFISWDGDYLIFSRKNRDRLKDGSQESDLFISFKLQNDIWAASIPFKNYIDFKYYGNCAIVTQDSKYLFFLDILEGKWQRYWISASIIDNIKKSHPQRENLKR